MSEIKMSMSTNRCIVTTSDSSEWLIPKYLNRELFSVKIKLFTPHWISGAWNHGAEKKRATRIVCHWKNSQI
jgi:hypothetical protein